MNFLHQEFQIGPENAVRVELDKQANVRLMDSTNYMAYKSGRAHRYFGGHAVKTPVVLRPPHSGTWHLVIDLGGYGGSVRASTSLI